MTYLACNIPPCKIWSVLFPPWYCHLHITYSTSANSPFKMLLNCHHQIHEGNVGIYYRHGALKDRVTDPGVTLITSIFILTSNIDYEDNKATIWRELHFKYYTAWISFTGTLSHALLWVIHGGPDQAWDCSGTMYSNTQSYKHMYTDGDYPNFGFVVFQIL